MPSYTSVRRFMRAQGLSRQRRRERLARSRWPQPPPGGRARGAQLRGRAHHGLWHPDFHDGSRKVLTARGRWVTPQLVACSTTTPASAVTRSGISMRSAEARARARARRLKRGLPRALMTDNGSAMKAAEIREGLELRSASWTPTLRVRPEQNAKREVFWAQVEGRLMAMLEGVADLTLELLNEATEAWVEREYNRAAALARSARRRWRATSAGPTWAGRVRRATSCGVPFAARPAHAAAERRHAHACGAGASRCRPACRHVERLRLRYARWDLRHVDVVDARTGADARDATRSTSSATPTASGGGSRSTTIAAPATAAPDAQGHGAAAARTDGRLRRHGVAAGLSADKRRRTTQPKEKPNR